MPAGAPGALHFQRAPQILKPHSTEWLAHHRGARPGDVQDRKRFLACVMVDMYADKCLNVLEVHTQHHLAPILCYLTDTPPFPAHRRGGGDFALDLSRPFMNKRSQE